MSTGYITREPQHLADASAVFEIREDRVPATDENDCCLEIENPDQQRREHRARPLSALSGLRRHHRLGRGRRRAGQPTLRRQGNLHQRVLRSGSRLRLPLRRLPVPRRILEPPLPEAPGGNPLKPNHRTAPPVSRRQTGRDDRPTVS